MIRSPNSSQEPGKAGRPAKVVADLDIGPGRSGGDLRVRGEVAVPREILQPALAAVAGQLTNTSDAKVDFNEATGRFEISGAYQMLWGLWKPRFKLELEPISQDGAFGFKVARFDHPGPSWPVDNYFLDRTATCTTDKGYPTTYDKAAKTFWVDADTIVHRWTHLSPYLRMDFSRTPLAVKSDGEGGIVVDMDGEPTRAPHSNKTHIRLDAEAIKLVFNAAFGEHFEVQAIEMAEGKFKLQGKARAPIIDGIVGLFAIFALAAGGNPQVGDTRIKVNVDIEQDGGLLRVRPDMGGQSAINKLVDAMRSRGLKAEAREGYAELVAADLFAKYGIERAALTPAGLMIEATTSPDAVAHPPGPR